MGVRDTVVLARGLGFAELRMDGLFRTRHKLLVHGVLPLGWGAVPGWEEVSIHG